MLDPGLEWRWIEFLGLSMLGIIIVLILSASLIQYWRGRSK